VSVGEAIDKLSILELKMKKIGDANKKKEVQKEINALSACHKYKEYYLYYNLLMYVNEQIWDMTDVIKGITIETISRKKLVQFNYQLQHKGAKKLFVVSVRNFY
jgi:hypothetical protein